MHCRRVACMLRASSLLLHRACDSVRVCICGVCIVSVCDMCVCLYVCAGVRVCDLEMFGTSPWLPCCYSPMTQPSNCWLFNQFLARLRIAFTSPPDDSSKIMYKLHKQQRSSVQYECNDAALGSSIADCRMVLIFVLVGAVVIVMIVHAVW